MTKINSTWILREALPRIIKAAVWGALTFLLVYYLPTVFYPKDLLPIDYLTPLSLFAAIAVFFAVAGQIFSGTIIGCGFGVAKAIVIIAYFFAFSDSGIFNITLPIEEVSVNLSVDISIFLLMIIGVNLLGITKNILESISILTDKATESNII
jgi:hypothetical protein